jgi:serine/threonine protein kinase
LSIQPEPFDLGYIVDGKYQIESIGLQGGMSAVYPALAVFGKGLFAVKVPLPCSDKAWSDLSFDREARALADLSHPNIVTLFDKGIVEEKSYLVLEWLPGGDLTKFISEHGAMSWVEFYEQIGRCLLKALAYAHKRRWVHRDLKPQNILFDKNGAPKITDFGIARNFSTPQLGLTFFQTGSPPYTPPEPDDGYQSERRDVYSWSAVAISCLTGKIYRTKDDLILALESLREFGVPKAVLRKGLAESPKERQEAANILLAELDSFHALALTNAQPRLDVYLQIRPNALVNLKGDFAAMDDEASVTYVTSDLNSGWTAFYDQDLGVVHLYGATLRLNCRIGNSDLEVQQLTSHSPDRASELREKHSNVPGVSFRTGRPSDAGAARTDFFTFLSRLDVYDNSRTNEAEIKRKSYWFDCWSDFLREKERIYKTRQRKFAARRILEDGEFYVATIEGDFEREDLGPSLVIQLDRGKPLIFAVIDVEADQIRLALRSGNRSDVPRENVSFETNFEAERKSLAKQRAALEEIRGGDAVSSTLGSTLSDPASAAPPEPAGLNFPSHLSQDKRQVLDKAMEVSSILVVNGPPGTGKTTLIAELISEYLHRYPDRRILLSSQTHVALDHIIAKLEEKALTNHVVRIMSPGMENSHKISKSVEHLLLERKVKEWCLQAEARSEGFMEQLATAKGISAYEVKVELLGRSYVETRKAISAFRNQLTEINKKKLNIEKHRLEQISEGQTPDAQEIVRQTENTLDEEDSLRQSLGSLEARLNRLINSLDRLDGLGGTFRDAKDSDLEDLLNGLVTKNVERANFLPLVQLHLDWLTRLGSERSFHGAVLREARVVAGTCIGLAGTPAFQDDQFDLCIVDEASKATATETLVPMSRSARTILVGDPKQLPPFVERGGDDSGEPAFTEDSRKSLLSVLLSQLPAANIEELVEQRRMCSTIGSLVSHVFYDDKLTNVRSDESRNRIVALFYPQAVTWISTSKLPKRKETEVAGETFENATEVQLVIEQLREISRRTRKSKRTIEVAVIAAYSAQVALLRDRISQQIGAHKGFSIDINTIDAFQGREADVCIYSVTRSNDEFRIGFQKERERLNVALSRARDALVIVGDAKACHRAHGRNPFKAVIDYIRANPDFCLLKEL